MSKKLLAITFFFFLLFSFHSETSAYPPTYNEKFVIRSLRTIHGAQATYSATTGNGNYGMFQNLAQANLINSVLATGLMYGYRYQITTVAQAGTTPAKFYVSARPNHYRKTGRKSFYIDESGVLRGADKNGAAATIADPEIEYECLPNEECTISALRAVHGAQIMYQATVGNGSFGSFNQLYVASLIGQSLASGFRHGYSFSCIVIPATATAPAFFKISVTPVNYGASGIRSFYIDATGIVRGADKNGAPADENDPPI